MTKPYTNYDRAKRAKWRREHSPCLYARLRVVLVLVAAGLATGGLLSLLDSAWSILPILATDCAVANWAAVRLCRIDDDERGGAL